MTRHEVHPERIPSRGQPARQHGALRQAGSPEPDVARPSSACFARPLKGPLLRPPSAAHMLRHTTYREPDDMFSAELKKGSSEMLILSLLEARPRHGYE